ncbi:MAG: hypothetical protein J7494_11010 [Sphingobium sp.]|nr:hypothetical protein [Sphingobium sp.]
MKTVVIPDLIRDPAFLSFAQVRKEAGPRIKSGVTIVREAVPLPRQSRRKAGLLLNLSPLEARPMSSMVIKPIIIKPTRTRGAVPVARTA